MCISLSIYLSIHPIYLSTYLASYLAAYPSIHPSIHPSMHPSIYPPMFRHASCAHVCMYVCAKITRHLHTPTLPHPWLKITMHLVQFLKRGAPCPRHDNDDNTEPLHTSRPRVCGFGSILLRSSSRSIQRLRNSILQNAAHARRTVTKSSARLAKVHTKDQRQPGSGHQTEHLWDFVFSIHGPG